MLVLYVYFVIILKSIHKSAEDNMSAKIFTSTIPKIDSDRIYEGLRIPASLENTTSVSFVLTQEPGKLKPKDLKIAIEKNRAQRELRAAEQKKIRDEGGGAGLLDLRSILSEERLNLIDVRKPRLVRSCFLLYGICFFCPQLGGSIQEATA